jgi:hypothetical protein
VDIHAVHTAIAAAVNGTALQRSTLQVSATAFMPLYPTVPHFYPHSWRITYDRTYGGTEGTPSGMNELTTTWHLLLSLADDESGFAEASRLAGSGESTIRARLLAARGAPGQDALDGAAEDLRLVTASGPSLVDIGDAHYLAIEMPVFVIGR